MERGSNTTSMRTAGRALITTMAILIVAATLTPSDDVASSDWSCIVCGEFGGRDVILNIALFVPLGAGLCLVGARFGAAVGIGLGTTLIVESLQFHVVPGRDAALGDVIMNTLGCTVGFALMANRATLLRPPSRLAAGLATVAGVAWLAMQALSTYAMVPVFPAETPHRAAAGRGLGGYYGDFPGRVDEASIDDTRLANTPYPAGRNYHNVVVREGSVVNAVARPESCSLGASAIVHVGDRRYREVLILALDDHHLRFGVSTGYQRLRVSPLRFRLRDAFDPARRCQVTGDAAQLRASYSRSAVLIHAKLGSEGGKRLELTPRASQAWILMLPFQWYLDGGTFNAILTAAWVAGLLLPFAWWSARIGDGRVTALTTALAAAIVLVAGFVAIPAAASAPFAGPLDWPAALATFAACWGWRLSRRRHHQVVDEHRLLDR